MYSQQLTKHFSLSRRCLSPESPRESQRDGGRQGSPRRTRRGGPQCLLAASPVSIAASEAREPRGRRAKEATGTGWTGASTRECSGASAARHKGCSSAASSRRLPDGDAQGTPGPDKVKLHLGRTSACARAGAPSKGQRTVPRNARPRSQRRGAAAEADGAPVMQAA